ncbi:unnamed protein product [Brachionus calyciflorus]|uniref:Uncharacterized protein n=1 Tax=Brachionus calyciflorus TaxID=104777 RepID=A0A813LYG1_9BILA|nr:unnamed protein product [Brachionus calyciflorus]
MIGKTDEADQQIEDDDENDTDAVDDIVCDEIMKIREELLNAKRKETEKESEINQDLNDDNENVVEDGSDIVNRENKIKSARREKMINSFGVGDYVLFRTDDVDRGMADPQNILCIIIDKKNDMFQLGCRAGVLDTYVACNSIEKNNLSTEFNIDFIPKTKAGDYVKVSATEAIRILSIGNGQVF